MSREEQICKFCMQVFEPLGFGAEKKLPLHKDPDDLRYGCKGAGQPLEKAALNYVAVEAAKSAKEKKVKLDPALANSRIPNFYEKERD